MSSQNHPFFVFTGNHRSRLREAKALLRLSSVGSLGSLMRWRRGAQGAVANAFAQSWLMHSCWGALLGRLTAVIVRQTAASSGHLFLDHSRSLNHLERIAMTHLELQSSQHSLLAFLRSPSQHSLVSQPISTWLSCAAHLSIAFRASHVYQSLPAQRVSA